MAASVTTCSSGASNQFSATRLDLTATTGLGRLATSTSSSPSRFIVMMAPCTAIKLSKTFSFSRKSLQRSGRVHALNLSLCVMMQ